MSDELQKTVRYSMRGALAALTKKTIIAEAAKVGPLHATATSREVHGVMATVEGRATRDGRGTPLSIKGMEFIGFEELSLERDFDKIEIDRRYQRAEQPYTVNSMALALKHGGASLAPVVLVKRGWKDEHTRPGVRYLLDGQQRILAHISAKVDTVMAVVYRSESLDAEKRAFSILNMTTKKVSGNEIVRSMGGAACSLIVACDADQAHPLHKRICWAASGRRSIVGNIGALMTLKGMGLALKAATAQNGVLKPISLVPRIEAKFDKKRADAFLRVLALTVRQGPESRAIASYVLALGQVCAEKWEGGKITAPTPVQCAALARVKWVQVCRHSTGLDMLPVVRERILRLWK